MSDRIRELKNKVVLGGMLLELSPASEGVTSDKGVSYFSFRGTLQCGPNPASIVKFRTFVKAKKANGDVSTNFPKVKDWYYNAKPKNHDNMIEPEPTMVQMLGSLADNPYVGSDGTLKEGTQYNMILFQDFEEYKAELDLEGYVMNIIPEYKMVGDIQNPTGREFMQLITRDMFGNTLDLKRIVVPKELVEPFVINGYEPGATATFYLSLMPNTTSTKSVGGGIGIQRVEGKTYLEMVVTGADPVTYDEVRMLDKKLIDNALKERQSHLAEVQKGGYKGSKTSNLSAAPSRNKIGGLDAVMSKPITSDDDFPF